MIGNGFQIPSLMIVLVLMAALQTTNAVHVPIHLPLQEMWETRLRANVKGTAFEPGAHETFPGVFRAKEVVEELWDLFKPLQLDKGRFDEWAVGFQA